MNRLVEARARIGEAMRQAQGKPDTTRPLEDILDEAIAHLDLELEEREAADASRVHHDGTLPEWRDGWPRGTWLDSFGFVFEVGMTAHDGEGSLMYLVPAIYFGLSAAPTRWITIYAATVSEARTKDCRIFRRIV